MNLGFFGDPSALPSAMEGLGFLDALNSAPVPGIKIKKKKKVLSPTAAKVRDTLGTLWVPFLQTFQLPFCGLFGSHFIDTSSPFLGTLSDSLVNALAAILWPLWVPFWKHF